MFKSWTESPESHTSTCDMFKSSTYTWQVILLSPAGCSVALSCPGKKIKKSWNSAERILLKWTGWRLSGRLRILLCPHPYPPSPSSPQTERTTKAKADVIILCLANVINSTTRRKKRRFIQQTPSPHTIDETDVSNPFKWLQVSQAWEHYSNKYISLE